MGGKSRETMDQFCFIRTEKIISDIVQDDKSGPKEKVII